jgi:hypothetical protein
MDRRVARGGSSSLSAHGCACGTGGVRLCRWALRVSACKGMMGFRMAELLRVMPPRRVLCNLLLLFLCQRRGADGAVRMPGFFGDNMVLQTRSQSGVRAFLSGWAEPGEVVSVTPGDYTATADAHGAWQLQLDPAPYGGSRTLTVSGSRGGPAAVARNVTHGDVWLCGGGANMAAPVGPLSAPLPRNLRLFVVGRATSSASPPAARGDVPAGSRGWFRSDDPTTLRDFEAASALCIEAAVQFTAATAPNRPLVNAVAVSC